MADAATLLERGRESHARRAWKDAWESLSRADHTSPLGADDLELLATSAYMIGRDDDYLSGLERAHHDWLDAGKSRRAVRCAFWLAMQFALRGDTGRATGWFGRAQRLIEQEADDCIERGYLLLPAALQHETAGEHERTYATAGDAARIGERFGDCDLVAIAIHMQGQARIRQGRIEEGLGLLDEAMVTVTSRELSPIVTGLIYCSVIDSCHEVYDLHRAQEWTAALTRWCEQQPDMVAFTGRCLVHRAEIMQVHGAWASALEEARRAARRQGMSRAGAGQAFYRQGELHRLRGEFDAAEEAYREASRNGREPQPGLAMLRLAQGNQNAAVAAIRRALGETTDPLARIQLLAACVEILLAAGETQEARGAIHELEEISAKHESDVLGAMVAQARGAWELSGGDVQASLVDLRRACQIWHDLEAPYEAARTRVLIAFACRELGDEDTAGMELDAAREVFRDLGAALDEARVQELSSAKAPRDTAGLTVREAQVLRLVAAGKTNREIAAMLFVSDKTIARHVSNIFTKLGVSTRAAATAYACKHDLA